MKLDTGKPPPISASLARLDPQASFSGLSGRQRSERSDDLHVYDQWTTAKWVQKQFQNLARPYFLLMQDVDLLKGFWMPFNFCLEYYQKILIKMFLFFLLCLKLHDREFFVQPGGGSELFRPRRGASGYFSARAGASGLLRVKIYDFGCGPPRAKKKALRAKFGPQARV